ncbi:MAG TPA: hypothetical protein VL947_07245 [Cytophagales bacterium]|nr:hypothetical protein [Cytophagales bacterium]
MKHLKYLLPFLIIVGLFKKQVYYRFFNIRISQYLDIEETLSIVDENLVTMIVLFFILWVLKLKNLKKDLRISSNDDYQLQHPVYRRLWYSFKQKLRYKVILVLVLSVSISSLLFWEGKSQLYYFILSTLLLLLASMIWIFLVVESYFSLVQISSKQLFEKFVLTLLIGLYLLSITYYAFNEILRTSKGLNERISYVKFQSGHVVNTSKSYFSIGQTQNYFFMYDNSADETTVYRREDIVEIRMK